MLVADLLRVLDRLAPWHLAQPWDNCGLLVGDAAAPVRRILAALELDEAVLGEAVAGGFDLMLTHHPVLFAPVRSLVESRPKERLLRGLVRQGISVIACHTNLDSAPGGLADVTAEALGLQNTVPLEPASAGWIKFVGFVPEEAVDRVVAAVFAAGAGGIGRYSECGFSSLGTGWFTPGSGSQPAVGEPGRAERTPEVRWETVVPRESIGAVARAFVATHPYEEPAFDLYPVDDVLPLVGLGRVGELAGGVPLGHLARTVAEVFELSSVAWSGDGDAEVRRVGILPGSGRGSVERAAGRCDVLITGDLGHHDGDLAAEKGLALIDAPHGELEWWALRRWSGSLDEELRSQGATLGLSDTWSPAWSRLQGPAKNKEVS